MFVPSVALVDGERRPHDDERLAARSDVASAASSGSVVVGARRPGVAGGEDAPVHRGEVRGEEDLARSRR